MIIEKTPKGYNIIALPEKTFTGVLQALKTSIQNSNTREEKQRLSQLRKAMTNAQPE